MSDDKCPGCEYVNQLVRWSHQPLDGSPPGAAGPCPAPREHVKPCPLAMHTCTACGSPADIQCVECGDWRCDKHWCGGQWCASYDVLNFAARACSQGEECSTNPERVKQAHDWMTGESGDLLEAFPRSDELRETCLRGLAELDPVIVAARRASKAIHAKAMAREAKVRAWCAEVKQDVDRDKLAIDAAVVADEVLEILDGKTGG